MAFGVRVQGRSAAVALIACLSSGGPALALTGTAQDYPTGFRVRIHHDSTAAGSVSPFTRQAALEAFQARYGGRWEWFWDSRAGVPVWIWGSGIALLDADESRGEVVEQQTRNFVDANPGIFQVASAQLELDHAYRNGDLWYVNFRRTVQGVAVHLSNVAFRFKAGRLVLFSAETYPEADGVDLRPQLGPEQALDVAASEVAFAAGIDTVEREPELRIYPEFREDGVEYRLAWLIETRNSAPEGWYGYFVDAHTGQLLEVWRQDAFEYSGEVQVDVEPRTVGDPIVSVAGAYNRVTLGGTSNQDTDATGRFSFAGGGGARSLTGSLRGAYVTVIRRDGTSASFNGTIQENVPLTLRWSSGNSDLAERDTFTGVNATNRFVATVLPNISWMNSSVTANVNLSGTCNAFWNGTSINFYRAGGGCNATGRIFDVVAHEWGHGLDQNAPGGAQDGGLGEFIGDLMAFVQTRDHRVGPGFFTNGAPVRDLEDPDFNCYDPSKTEVHDAGQLLGAVVYDIMNDYERVGVTGEALKHRLIAPVAGAQTRSQWYREMLVVDDDDGNLANGTPHECLIYNQFKLHSCGSTRWPGLPAGDPPNCSAGTRTHFTATDVPKGIPDNDSSGATSTMSVSGTMTIDDLDITLDVAHSAIGDLKLVLSHASTDTVQVVLHDRTGGQLDNIVTNYDRQSPPKEPLAVFNGRSVQGTWALQAIDSQSGNTGTIRSWRLEVRPRN
jgi:subtilisin-like proprotein convertase family protein/Zn-dependent metalloprotease